jgi:hypothetical protein
MIQDSDRLELFKIQLQQAESVRRHYQSVDVAFIIPALQSVLYAIGLTGVLSVISALFEWPLKYTLPGLCFVFLFSFLWFFDNRRKNWDALIWNLEERVNLDLNDDGEVGQPASTKGERIAYILREVLDRYYLENQKVDRETLEKLGLCTQPEWNTVNDILKRLGVKGPRDFIMEDYAKALAAYRTRVVVFPDVIHVRHPGDNGSEIIHL